MNKYASYIAIFLAYILGGGSLVMFAAFCYVGSLHLVRLGLNEGGILFFDFCLSIVFFLQHSGMVRKPFRRFLSRFIPEAYVSAILRDILRHRFIRSYHLLAGIIQYGCNS